jgi:hypothetical protein
LFSSPSKRIEKIPLVDVCRRPLKIGERHISMPCALVAAYHVDSEVVPTSNSSLFNRVNK